MAKSPKNAPAASLNMALLSSIALATIAGGFLYIPPSPDAKFLVDGAYIEVNASMINENQEAAAKATQKGLDEHNKATSGAAGAGTGTPAPAAKPKFEIETIAMPVAKRNPGGASNLYPFDDLPAPAATGEVSAFFVPVTAERPEPWKSLASTVSSAQKRYATKTGTEAYTAGDGSTKQRNVYSYGRKFRVSEGVKKAADGTETKGAYVARTA